MSEIREIKRFSAFEEGVTTLHVSLGARLRRELEAEARRRQVNRSSLVRELIQAGLKATRPSEAVQP